MQRYAIIVDPLSTGREYPAAFRAEGVSPIAVLSTAEPVDVLKDSWHPENFDQVHYFDGDLDGLATSLRKYDPIAILPGAESGIRLYEALVPLVLPGTGNVPELGDARRDKWEMAKAVAAAGVPHLRQLFSADADEITNWLAETGLDAHDLVVKPPNSGGTDDVHMVPAGGDWRPLFDRMVTQVNHLGLVNGGILIQEFAEGTEYLVDSYSVDGKHGLVDICRYTKLRKGDRIGIYDRVDFLSPEDPEVATIWQYTLQILDALGFRNGCGHAEIMLTPDGPRLIEIAERPAGGGHQVISKIATGDNHILRTVSHRVHGEFKPSYELLQHLCGVFVSAPHAGIWRNAEIFDELEQLPTYVDKNFPKGTGDYVESTDDLSSFLAWVTLVAPDAEAINVDYRRVKELEAQIVIEPVQAAAASTH
ncbi:MAG: ATP-grasp domain-containing protein [Actinomycetota bacterium]|nr:ATP-grasp domain-containing protein [Actinomycetota bacterium]MDQ2959129.1 ATP-grasp domain-containing protein [Actinomycetota bacterium]